MAYIDSALDYSWEVLKIATENSSMTVKYSVDSSLGLPDIFRRYPLQSNQFSVAAVTAVAETGAQSAILQWDILDQASDNFPTFSDSAFIGVVNSARYKPRISSGELIPDVFNRQLFKYTYRDSENDDATVTIPVRVALDSDEKITFRSATEIGNLTLWNYLKSDANDDTLDSYGPVIGFSSNTGAEMVAQASFDASAAGSFNWSTDEISSFGVSSVTRTGTGVFQVNFSTPLTDLNYTVITGVGDQDYSGVGSSPRQVTITNRTASSVTLVVERTDDAVNDDNGYIAIAVYDASSSEYASISKKGVEFMLGYPIVFGDSCANELQSSLSLNDSDFVTWMLAAGATSLTTVY